MSIASRLTRMAVFAALAAGVFALATPNSAEASCLPASLKSKLSRIHSKFGPVRIVSTHRPGARIAGSGKRSFHSSCRAVDFHPPKGKHAEVVAWLKANHSGGVGTYSCGMHHIHMDNGPRVRFHHCVNAKGRPIGKRRRYASKKKRYSKKRYAAYAKSSKRAGKKTRKSYASKGRPKIGYKAKPKAKTIKVARNSAWKITSYSR